MNDAPRLHFRLRSCLQAILDLEPELQTIDLAEPLLAELATLKNIYNKLDTLMIQETDVLRIENATAHFLQELKGTVKESGPRQGQRFLQ